jgi:hypothetical protein
MRNLIISLMAALCLALPTTASASYNLTQQTAERYAEQTAANLYADYGIAYATTGAYCRPQGAAHRDRYFGTWHRWTCTWVGNDFDGDEAFGRLRIVGGSGYYDYRYKVLNGIHWS